MVPATLGTMKACHACVSFKLLREASNFLGTDRAICGSDGVKLKSIPKPTDRFLSPSFLFFFFFFFFFFLMALDSSSLPSSLLRLPFLNQRLLGWSRRSVGRPSLHFQDPLNHSTAAPAFA